MVRNIVEQAAVRDIQEVCVYESSGCDIHFLSIFHSIYGIIHLMYHKCAQLHSPQAVRKSS